MLSADSAREPRGWSRPKYTRSFGGKEFDGLLLGVSVRYLETEFIEEVEEQFGIGADPSYLDIHTKVFCGPTAKGRGKTCPRDGLPGCSYVDALETVHVGKADVMLSWCRLTSVRTVVGALSGWCRNVGKDSEDVYVWQCVLCHNHFRDSHMYSEGLAKPACASDNDDCTSAGVMPTTPRNGEPRRGMVASVTDSIAAFHWRLRNIGTLLVLCSPLKSPPYLRRLWCLFEFFTACASQYGNVHVISADADEVEFRHALTTDGFSSYYEAFGKVDIQSAETTISPDIQGIFQSLRAEVGKRADQKAVAASSSAERSEVFQACCCGWNNSSSSKSCVSCGRRLSQVAAPLSSSPGHRRRKAPSLTPSQTMPQPLHGDMPQHFGDIDEFSINAATPTTPRTGEDPGRRSPEIMKENQAEIAETDDISDLSVVNSEVTRVFRRWLFDKAQEALQLLVSAPGPVPLEAFLNVAGLLRMDSDFEHFVFVVLQQGIRYSQATSATSSPGYGVLLREMGSCLTRLRRFQEALSHFHSARRFYESEDAVSSPEYVELLRAISQHAVASSSFEEKHRPVTNLVTIKQVPLPANTVRSRFSDSPGILCEDPLQDLQAAFVCVPTCICNTSTNDFSQIIDLSREDTKEMSSGVGIPIPGFAFPKDEDVDGFSTNNLVDFDTLMKERSQITATRQRANRLNHPPARQEPMEPADAGFLDMLLLWTSKIGLTPSSGCGSSAGVPTLLRGCTHRTGPQEEEWV